MFFSTFSVALAGVVTVVSAAPVAEPGSVDIATRGLISSVQTKAATALSSVDALLEGFCSAEWKCGFTTNGTIGDLLVDGSKYTNMATVNAWCSEGHCYGTSDTSVEFPAPFTITCNGGACSGTAYGDASDLFVNGPQLELWGWLTPSGYCKDGVCYASLTTVGDPAYKS